MMKGIKGTVGVIALLMLGLSSGQASTLAIIDSGTDMKHIEISDYAWINPNDVPDTGRDEDRNGYPDDIHGWNFAESNNEVIDYKYLSYYGADIKRFFDLQLKAMMGTITQDEMDWMRSQLEDEEFLKRIQAYGNFMHGTHVGHIALRATQDSRLMAIKMIPTEVDLPFYMRPREEANKGLRERLLKEGLKLLASQQMKMLEEISAYVDSHGVDVANGSFGTGYAQASTIVATLFETIMRREPTEEELKDISLVFLNELISKGRAMVDLAPETLFVFASGNDGTNNDELPTSPANIDADNVITVGATVGFGDVATFSNIGQKTVDVLAPGVGIRAAIPGDRYLRVSGTSQAAPYVAGIATLLKEMNPELSPAQLKRVIMETVDKRDELQDVVKTSGVVNRDRARRAAELVSSIGLDEAIARSLEIVPDQDFERTKSLLPVGAKELVLPLPSPFALR